MRAHSFRTVRQGSRDRTNTLVSGQTGNRVEECLRCLASSPPLFLFYLAHPQEMVMPIFLRILHRYPFTDLHRNGLTSLLAFLNTIKFLAKTDHRADNLSQ